MAKKGYDYDWQYDWVIKKQGGKIPVDTKPANITPAKKESTND